MSMTYHKTITSRGKPPCIVDGCGFIVERTSGDKTIWCCNRKRHDQCKARLHTINNRVVHTIGTHNHKPNASAVEVMQTRAEMNQQSKSSNRSTHDIIATDVASLSAQAVASLPELNNLKRTIRCIRQKAQNSIALPSSVKTLSIPSHLTTTLSNKLFLQYD